MLTRLKSFPVDNEKLNQDLEKFLTERKTLNASGKGSIKKALDRFKDALKEAGWQENAKTIRQQEGNISFTSKKINEIVAEYQKVALYADPESESDEKKFNLKTKETELDRALERIQRAATSNSPSAYPATSRTL